MQSDAGMRLGGGPWPVNSMISARAATAAGDLTRQPYSGPWRHRIRAAFANLRAETRGESWLMAFPGRPGGRSWSGTPWVWQGFLTVKQGTCNGTRT